MNQLLWYYADLEKRKCYHTPDGLADFDNEDKACSIWRRFANLFETSQSLFWASFGLVDLMAFELKGIKSFTRFWALLMFGSYSVINIIVLLNMLIAMMSNSYQIISERSDTEWKFARSRLWMSYFEEGDTVPPPFNLIPTTKGLSKTLGCRKGVKKSGSIMKKCHEKAMERHETVMHLLVRRYVTAETRKRDEFGVTEDDVMEIRQDISTLRYELIDILKNNGMRTPKLHKDDVQVPGKKNKIMERRLQKGFQIGLVEGIVNDAISSNKEPRDVFSKIARAIGRRSSSRSKKKDWNAMVRKNTTIRDPIGSSNEAFVRQSRQSIRRHIISNYGDALVNMDPEKLIEYNPKLSSVTPATRVAYAKFKVAKIKQEYNEQNAIDKQETADEINKPSEHSNTSTPNKSNASSTKKRTLSDEINKGSISRPRPVSSLKKSETSSAQPTALCSDMEQESLQQSASETEIKLEETSIKVDIQTEDSINSSANEEDTAEPSRTSALVKKDFRSRTPIQEEDEEDFNQHAGVESKKEENNKNQEKINETDKEEIAAAPVVQSTLKTCITKPSGKSKVTGEVIAGWL